jgi:hypothetical protein
MRRRSRRIRAGPGGKPRRQRQAREYWTPAAILDGDRSLCEYRAPMTAIPASDGHVLPPRVGWQFNGSVARPYGLQNRGATSLSIERDALPSSAGHGLLSPATTDRLLYRSQHIELAKIFCRRITGFSGCPEDLALSPTSRHRLCHITLLS